MIVDSQQSALELAQAWRSQPKSGARHLVLAALGARRIARLDRSSGRTRGAVEAARRAGLLLALAFELDAEAARSMQASASRNGW
jgi:hypothetical protein